MTLTQLIPSVADTIVLEWDWYNCSQRDFDFLTCILFCILFIYTSKHINVESTLKQRWSSTFINIVSTLIFVWKWKLSRRTFIDVFQRWQNIVEATSMELRRFSVDESTLFQRWNLVEKESSADVCLSTLFQRWQNNVETTLKELHQFNVDNPMLFQRWYSVENQGWGVNVCSSALFQR